MIEKSKIAAAAALLGFFGVRTAADIIYPVAGLILQTLILVKVW